MQSLGGYLVAAGTVLVTPAFGCPVLNQSAKTVLGDLYFIYFFMCTAHLLSCITMNREESARDWGGFASEGVCSPAIQPR